MTSYATPALRVAAAATLVASALALSACESRTSEGESGAEDNPVAAARDFITDGVVDHSGFEACAYLTPEQQRGAARRGGGSDCREAFDDARLALGRHEIQTVHQVEQLPAQLMTDGKQVVVRLGRDQASIELKLVRADFAEQQEFQPPDTEWRIARGALAVIPSAPHG